MKRELTPIQLAGLLILIGALYSIVSSRFPTVIPGFSPIMAIAFVGAMYLPRKWGWLVGPVIVAITSLAYLETNYKTLGEMFSVWSLAYLVIYGAAGLFGIFLAQSKTLLKIIGGSIVCSLTFYFVSNTISWLTYQTPTYDAGYAPTLAGWVQANTTGVPGFEPTWHFLRNGMAGDLLFAMILLFLLDRSVFFGHVPAKTSPQAA